MAENPVKVKMPDLSIELPTKKFWTAVGVEEAKAIRKRTETQGEDYTGKKFTPYTKEYAKRRAKKGRSTTPNLSFTGRMLGSMARGIRASSNQVRIILSGAEGGKAWNNEQNGRTFFDLSNGRKRAIAKGVTDWMTKRNKLKK